VCDGRPQPERIEGREYSFACDVWSLGLTLFECATGTCVCPCVLLWVRGPTRCRYPFESPAKARGKLEFFDVFHCIVQQPPPVLPADRFSPELCDFIGEWCVPPPFPLSC
jgi:mitogen-activated protein kinase kinase 1